MTLDSESFTLPSIAAGVQNTIGSSSNPASISNYIPDTLPQTALSAAPGINGNTGTLGKFTDTILDLAGLFGRAAIGSEYPTGQQSPQQVAAANQAAGKAATPSGLPFDPKYLVWGIGGLVALVSVVVIVRAASK